MGATYLSAFYYCMASSSYKSDSGYWYFRFSDVTDMNGLIDPAVLTLMATGGQNVARQFLVYNIKTLSADE